jgi:hypothetical protein
MDRSMPAGHEDDAIRSIVERQVGHRPLDKLRWAISNDPGRVPEFVRTAQRALGNLS